MKGYAFVLSSVALFASCAAPVLAQDSNPVLDYLQSVNDYWIGGRLQWPDQLWCMKALTEGDCAERQDDAPEDSFYRDYRKSCVWCPVDVEKYGIDGLCSVKSFKIDEEDTSEVCDNIDAAFAAVDGYGGTPEDGIPLDDIILCGYDKSSNCTDGCLQCNLRQDNLLFTPIFINSLCVPEDFYSTLCDMFNGAPITTTSSTTTMSTSDAPVTTTKDGHAALSSPSAWLLLAATAIAVSWSN